MIDNDNVVDILLVEDNPSDAELEVHALKKYNLANNLEWVKDGEAALDYLFYRGKYADRKTGYPHVVLLDLRLPKIDGMEVLREIRNNEKTRELPVVILTSSQEDRDLTESYNLGVNSFVTKPIAFDEFAKTVADLGLYWVLVNRVPSSMKTE